MLSFLRKYPALLTFGLLTAMFSSPGQTFLVSLFIPAMRESLHMSKTEIAGLYSMATLISAIMLPMIGTLLDRIHLSAFTIISAILLALGCGVLYGSTGTVTVFIGFLLVRNMGQGNMTIISTTTMARIFGRLRGRALGVANLGFPFGEMIFPSVVSFWILSAGWRHAWLYLAVLIVGFLIPAVFFLLRTDTHKKVQRDIEHAAENESKKLNVATETLDWSVRAILQDPRYYLLLVPMLVPPTFFTALFFHHAALFEWKGWSLQVIALGFIVFGFMRALVSFMAGPLVDRYSACRLYPVNLMPLCLALLFFAFGKPEIFGFLYLGFSGMTMGLSMTTSSALYAELYGVRSLGSLKGVNSFIVVLATAIAPVLMGKLLDARVSPIFLLWGMLAATMLGIFCAALVCYLPNQKKK